MRREKEDSFSELRSLSRQRERESAPHLGWLRDVIYDQRSRAISEINRGQRAVACMQSVRGG